MNGHVEEIDAIMEEMEANTPKSGESSKSFESFHTEKVTVTEEVIVKFSDVPDAERVKKPEARSFISKLFTSEATKPGIKHPSRPTNERYYDFTNKNVGIALIFNQVKVKDEPERKGSYKDASDLEEVLTEKGFKVLVYTDFTLSEIKSKLLQGKK